MRITITARHVALENGLRARAQDLIEKVAKVVRRPSRAHVVFAEDHGEAAVEIELFAPRGRVHVAQGVGADQRTALDAAIARLKRQLLDEKQPPRPRPRRARASNPQ